MATSIDKLLEKERPVSPTPSNVSLKSDWSKDDPLNFSKGELGPFEREIPVSLTPSNVSTKSDGSKDDPFDFSKGELGLLEKERPVSPAPSNVSLKSDWSKDDPLNFSKGELGLLEKERPVSPTPSNVSLKSDWSKDDPLNFSKGELGPFEREIPVSLTPSNVSTKSDGSKDDPFDFSKGELGPLQQQGPVPRCPTMSCVQSMDGPAPSNVSLKSDWSKDDPLNFSKGELGLLEKERPVSPAPSNVSLKSDWSKDDPLNFSKGELGLLEKERPVSPTPNNVSLKSDWSKDDPLNFSKGELGPFEREIPVSLTPSNVSTKSDGSKDDPFDFSKGELGPLQQQGPVPRCPTMSCVQSMDEKDAKHKLKENLKERILKDNINKETDTELYEIKDVKNKEDAEKPVQSYNEIFKTSIKNVRTVLMKGVAGIGKTFQTKRFMVDWANGNSNKDIDLIVSFDFSELNSRRGQDQSMEDLLNDFFKQRVPTYDDYRVAFVLDGLEKCKLDLDLKNKDLTDIKEKASVDVLLTNLIKGKLLPSAHLWIISQPSGVDKIPSQYIQKVTECRETLKRRQHLVSNLRTRFLKYTQVEDINHPNQKNTEHIIRRNSTGEVNDEEKNGQPVPKSVTKVNAISEIFKDEKDQTIRTVLTIGEADIGKSFHVQKFTRQWAEKKDKCFVFTWLKDSLWGKAKDAEELLFPLSFSELKLIKEEKVSLVGLLNHFFEETKESVISDYARFKVLFILDGLDASELPLVKDDILTDVRETASVDVLLINLIKGNLLPTAKLWITTQPSSLKLLPVDSFDRMTEIRESKEKLTADLKKRILSQPEVEQSQHETELYEIKAVKNKEDEQKLVQSYNEIFKTSTKNEVRTVLMKGVAGVGKTFQTKMFMVDWANGNSNKDIDLIVSFDFSELNSRRGQDQSMEDLLNDFFKQRVPTYDDYRVAFVLDGLEKCKLDLDVEKYEDLTDIKEKASMDVLLTNLIKGNLLPSAHLWIISQPSGVDKIPSQYIQKVTKCREKKCKLTENLKKRILSQPEVEQSQRDTELYEIKAVKNKEDEQKLVQSYSKIFKTSTKNEVRAVLMKGVAGVGKTFQTKMFMVDWANGNSNKDIDLIVSFDFSELNSRRGQDQSMEDLLNDFFNDIKHLRVPTYDDYRVGFVLDGLEKCKLDLDFEKNKDLTDINEKASMDVLLTNLIKGNLLPSAHLWIISQPSGVDKIPSQYIQKVTECRETLKRRQQLAAKLRTRFRGEYTQVEDIKHPNQKNTEHIITRNSTGEVNDEEKNGQPVLKSVTKVNAISEIFKDEKDQTIRTVLTIGEADIGKSFHVQKFTRQWAEKKDKCSVFTWLKDSLWGEAKDAEELLFPLSFSKLKLIKEEKVSLVGLLNHFFKETKESVISDYARFKVLFILDGLDASELSLDKGDILTDVREPASVDVLLTNLIKGNLLPTAKLWITTRRSSLKLLSVDSIDRMTEIREKPDVASQQKLKSQLKEQFTLVSEGIDRQKTSALLNEIYTDLYIVEGERGEVNVQHEFRQVQEAKFKPVREETPIKYHDIFKPASGENKSIRTVLTIGVAGIGKTFASMKYMLDWAEGTANKNIYYTFSLPFRELNLRKDREHSFEELIHQFFPVMKTSEINNYDKYEILIVLDGLDECRLDLNFSESMDWIDVRKATSVNVLLTNLIKGNLLPKAQIWITSRPAASNIIPAGKVDRVTEVRGFNDEQKEEYFRKRFSEKDLAEKILSHVKKSRSLYIMCHIPVFCWITSKVLEDFVNRNQEEGMPKTLTDMYIHFLLLQCRQANVKYGGEETSESSETYSCWNTRNKDTVLSLGKLAFEELEKGNLLFTEENLIECGIDIKKTAVFSGLFTQVIQEGCRLYQKSFFCFVHLSIQEFLAAFYVSHRFNNEGENLLTKPASVVADLPAASFYKTAVDKALDSENGDWDLFLRFLLGLSLETNQKLLQELLKKAENNRETNEETIKYIKGKISNEIIDADKKLSLFHCLNELNDHSLVKEVKKCLQSETLAFENFTASQWSALIFVLLMSDENLDVFDLKKYLKSEKVLLGMLPVVKVSKTTLLSWCELSEESCKGLTSLVLTSASSNLTKLDLSHNDLLDSGVEVLANGLKDLHCKLETLKLSGCQVTEKGCSDLASALTSNTASHLKQLDLSYNHPGEKGREMLQAIKDNPTMKLKTLCLDHDGEHRLKPGLKKYGTDLKFDENTISKRLVLSEGNRKVKTVQKVEEKVARTVNDDRFNRSQVFCEEGLKGLCYWEVEWRGTVGIAVSYRDVSRKWDSSGGLGCNEMSWSLLCSRTGYTAMHGKTSKLIQLPPSQKIAVLLDWEGGTLRYYSVTSGKLSLIYTFHAKFTKPLFPGFWFKRGSVTLCEID
ncbi:uncharacterized protein LOC108891710 isoform X10 [Lates calcarifer]|uniref:Uncharacterized protein LOC108891710 isoform X10 n=1 Tax=Lates calcarifer TaxID=8187 RepID=A0A4W6C4U4_LATCA|nr:uncharacterized protein LOC108891710 isoform X10 [Lates calcarifer]